jgi:hypothetical protein
MPKLSEHVRNGRVRNSAAVVAGLLPLLTVALFACLPMACITKDPPSTTFFESNIAPVLSTTCVRSATGSGCHVSDSHGNAFGNLDVSSYTDIDKRRDLLATYGPYGQPSLLVKNVLPFTVTIQAYDGTVVHVTTDIKHSGGPLLDATGGAFQALKQWINNGATAQNTGIPVSTLVRYPCLDIDPDMTVEPFKSSSYVASSIDHSKADYATFKSTVAPYIQTTCAAGNCHGVKTNELYFLCGNDQAQIDWNYFTAGQYITSPPATSELIRRPLAPQAGGSFHEGGTIFPTASDPNYQAFLKWAQQHGATTFPADKNLQFFATRVQPMLVKKGCMMLQCHSAAMGHDYRLRGGSGGSFSYDATIRNYQLTLAQMSFESPTVDASRMVRKNLLRPVVAGDPISTPLEFVDSGAPVETGAGPSPDAGGTPDATTDAGSDAGSDAASDAGSDAGSSGGTGSDAMVAGAPTIGTPLGILHRGGPLLEDFGTAGPSGAVCDAANYAYDDPNFDLDSAPAYCIIREWFTREQAARGLAPLSAIVYVKRPLPTGPDRSQDWDVFLGPAELHVAKASLNASGGVTLGADAAVDLTTCGLAAGADVKRPAVSWDGTKIAFAARSTASDPLAVYEMNADGTGCAKLPFNDFTPPPAPAGCTTLSGAQVHNFDPAYSPDGRIVFVSTRGNLALAQANVDYCGPQHTPADPTKLNANLYAYDPSASSGGSDGVTQMTFLLNMERHPSFMDDGRVIFTTEKRAPGFYQLALRRQNLDTGDYHPLYGQRATIGYDQVDEVAHLSDKNYAAIFSMAGALHQGGTLGIFNRSVGIDFTSSNPNDYLIDPTVIDPSSPSSIEPSFFNHSLSFPDPNASGTPGTAGNIYTSPAQLPGGTVLVSMSPTPQDPATFDGSYDLVVLDPETGNTTTLVPGNGGQVIEARGVYARAVRGPNLPANLTAAFDDPNAHSVVTPGEANVDMTILDVPILASLVFQNTPTGRIFDPGVGSFDVYEDMPPTPDVTSLGAAGQYVATDAYGSVYVRRRLLGTQPILGDGSAHIKIPGGVPIVLHFPDTDLSKSKSLPRWQREEMGFSPGETVNEMLKQPFFDNVCGQCHGSISGQQIDVAVKPDILTQASLVAARITAASSLGLTVGSRTTTFVGPPATP